MSNNAFDLLNKVKSESVYAEKNGVGVFKAPEFSNRKELTHGFTTRRGGVSVGPFSSLNLGVTRDEPPVNIDDNYHRLCDAHGLVYEELALVNHVHGAHIIRVSSADAGRGLYRRPLPFSDGLVTNDPNVTLLTSHADCSAFFVYDDKTRSIGLAHAGWKGMISRIGGALIKTMSSEFESDPKNLVVAIGPCICQNCFEVDAELGKRFADEFNCPNISMDGKPGKAHISLHVAGIIQLMDEGVPAENITIMPNCTFEEKDLFYSYRRDGEKTGSMDAYLRLK